MLESSRVRCKMAALIK